MINLNAINRGTIVGDKKDAAELLASLFDKKFNHPSDRSMNWKSATGGTNDSYANVTATINNVVKPISNTNNNNTATTNHVAQQPKQQQTKRSTLNSAPKRVTPAPVTPKKVDVMATTSATKSITKQRTIQEELDAKRDTLCQLLNLKSGLRNLETWHDEDGENVDERCFGELVDPDNPEGWSPADMFDYNEKRHKIISSYTDRTLSDNYTTPLPKAKSKSVLRTATQLAKEIEARATEEGRVTPESSDDDELFEQERLNRVLFKKQKQLEQSRNPISPNNQQRNRNHQNPTKTTASTTGTTQANQTTKASNEYQIDVSQLINSVLMSCNQTTRSCAKTPSQYSNKSTETPATASLSSSPMLNDSNNIIKPVASSSRNILRACLT